MAADITQFKADYRCKLNAQQCIHIIMAKSILPTCKHNLRRSLNRHVLLFLFFSYTCNDWITDITSKHMLANLLAICSALHAPCSLIIYSY